MATAFAAQLRAAGTYNSPGVAVTRLKEHDVQVLLTGLSAAAIADASLLFTFIVQVNDAASGNANGWYGVYGPDATNCGQTDHGGQPITPGFTFRNRSIPDTAVRVRLQIQTNKSETWGADVTVA
jgi:hypothetical protein